jgi:Protein of unknown function (DUF3558)
VTSGSSPRRVLLALALALAVLVAGCGGEGGPAQKAPPGSLDNPLVSKAEHDGTDPDAPGDATKPGYAALVDRQSGKPSQRSSPCAFVTKRQAQDIVGSELLDPIEAPQGPTCIYRDRDGETFITVAMQQEGFDALRRQIDRIRRVSVGDRRAYCGVHGQPALFVPVGDSRVLSVTAQCEVAMQFARSAVRRLGR